MEVLGVKKRKFMKRNQIEFAFRQYSLFGAMKLGGKRLYIDGDVADALVGLAAKRYRKGEA